MFNPNMFHSLYRKICALVFMLLGLSVMLNLTQAQAQAQAQGGGGFDHGATAFPLTGAHELVRCETCHIKGIFKTTPKVCATCHVVGNQRDAVAPSAKHIAMTNPPIQTSLACDSCHNTSTFSAAQFNHSLVQPGFCGVCHNGVRAQGVSANHVETGGLSCDECHSSSAYVPVPMFPHAMLNGDLTTCTTCHDGRIAKGMPANHLPRSNSAQCGSCHVSSTLNGFFSFAGGQMDHTGLTTACADCHGPSVTGSSFAGISSIVVMPPISPAGPNSHIPSSPTCETCHLSTMPTALVAANASQTTGPGTKFLTPTPTNAQIHSGITGGCNSCHDTGLVWMGMSSYPMAPSVVTADAHYTGFQTRPVAAASNYSVADANHPAGDCSQCHSGTDYFLAIVVPANHIPYASTASCASCHTTSDNTVMPTLANIHANLQSTTTNCAQCHAASVVDGFKTSHLTIVGPPADHMPITTACETCHYAKGSSVTPGTPMAVGAKFNNSLMSHSGITTGCVACHVASGTTASFAGISKIVGMPATSPAGVNSHIPSSTTCENCHLSATPSGLVAANATKTAPGTAFLTPAPTTTQIHSGVTSGCNSCHDTGMVWMSMGQYPIAPTKLTSGANYTGFQTRPVTAASTYSVADGAHTTTGDCSQCHSGTNYFSAIAVSSNHIPYATGAQCTVCHTSNDFAVMPTLANIHANIQNTTANCAQCHAANVVDGFKTTHLTIVGPPSNHIPITTACETCHFVAGSSVTPGTPMPTGAKFNNSLMSHRGITTGCVACHELSGTASSFAGISKIVGMPATTPVGASGGNSHIPSSSTCETCHLGTTPTGLVPASATKTAPGTAFLTPVPTTVQIHTGITTACSSCHDTSYVWMGMNQYPIAPTTLGTSLTQYTGFHTRPVTLASTYSVADGAHPDGECSQCHAGTTYFSGVPVPTNHIPYATGAQCAVCHTTSDYAAMPTLANIHANLQSTTTNCAQCHAASVVAGFAIPAAKFTIVGPPSNHMPITTACETCHFVAGSSVTPGTPMAEGTKFNNSLMSHSGITTGCVNCHVASGTTVSFVGITKIVGMPATTPVGATGGNSHIPSSTTCETCHLGSTPTGLVAASATKTAPGTAFQTPAPTTSQIHTGITGGCVSCHDTGYVWMGMSSYPIAPTVITSGAQYTGFHTRPVTAAGTFNVADASHPAGECSQCHKEGTNFFSGNVLPSNHIPISTAAMSQCSVCHTSNDLTAMPTLANIHANLQSNTTNCAQCHAASVVASFTTTHLTIVGPPSNHMPITTACETCHFVAGSSVTPGTPMAQGTKFNNSLMSHSGITTGCVNCHVASGTTVSFVGITKIVGMPATTPVGATGGNSHIPSGTTCETCHLSSTPTGLVAASATKTAPGTAFQTPAPTTSQIHTGITGGCVSCHDTGYVWMGMSSYPIAPTVITSGAQYTGFHTRPVTAAGTFNVADASHPAGECSNSGCHTGTAYFSGDVKPTNHIPYVSTALCTACHTTTDYTAMPTLANIHANLQSTTTNCAQCHAASVVASFTTTHLTIVGPPSNHMPITTACETCHFVAGSSVTPGTPMAQGTKFNKSLMSHSGITTGCVNCHVASGTTVSFVGITKIVGMPATTPVGATGGNSHIPSSTTCETCHLGSTPTGLVAASATKTAPGTAFQTPAPTTSQIHTGITGGCASCHDTGYVWMGMGSYPIAPTVMGTSSTQYTGFNTRPVTAASTYSVADSAHPAGECSNSGCHSGTNYFSGAVKPTGHMPTTLTCGTCHIVSGDYSVAGLASNTILHTGISTGCITCHTAGTGKGPFAGCTTQAACTSPPPVSYQPMVMPLLAGSLPTAPSASTHIPAAGIACELCHSATVFTNFSGMNMKSNATAHAAVSSATCMSCHETAYAWYGVTIKKRPSGHHTGTDCTNGSNCHSKTNFGSFNNAARVRPLMRGAAGTISQRFLPGVGLTTDPLVGGSSVFSHAGVAPGQCVTCHNGQVASGLPPVHPQTRMSCDNCHRTTAWLPAQFSHQGVLQSQCLTCHNGVSASGRPAGHFVTGRSCDSCHKTVAWLPVSYTHISPLYQAQPGNPTCVTCHVTNGEIIPRQMRGNNRPRPVPVHTGP